MEAPSGPVEPAPAGSEWRAFLLAAAVLAAAVLAIFGDFLFGAEGRIPTSHMGDTARYFVYARTFAAEQILQGNLPLWNPHTFAGTPFVGVFQSSVFYPLNIIHLILPLERAISLEFALNLFLLGVFVYLWLRGRGLDAVAALFAALSLVFSGPSFLRVLAGALTVIGTYAWVPLVLLSIDRLAARWSLGWILVGVVAVSMMILAGHPATVFMAAVATGLYCLPAILRSGERWRLIGRLALVAILPLFVAAVQLWTGLQVAAEATRQSGMPFGFATTFSFPPESLLTLFVPGFFGNEVEYFGRWFYWDASAYFGLTALVLSVHGALRGRGEFHRTALVLLAVLVVLSLGRYTPLYRLLYEVVPGFAYVRAPSKFMFLATIFAAGLAGLGVDRLLRDPGHVRRTAACALAATLGLALLWLGVWGSTQGAAFVSPAEWLASIADLERVGRWNLAAWKTVLLRGLAISAGLAGAVSVLIWIAGRRRAAVWLVLALGTAELLLFARGHVRPLSLARSGPHPQLFKLYLDAGEQRVLELDSRTNKVLRARGYSLWGYDSVVLRRYLEFMALTQGVTPDQLDNIRGRKPTQFHPLFAMLRVKSSIEKSGHVHRHAGAMPRLSLLRNYRVLNGPDAVLAAIAQPDFDPRSAVLLEQEPTQKPVSSGGQGRIELLDESTDHLSVAVEIASPAILLVTDVYSDGWRALALPGSVQRDYQVLPANYVLRAIPLAAGRHRLRLEYSPVAFRLGAWASAISCLMLAGATAYWALHMRRKRSLARLRTDR